MQARLISWIPSLLVAGMLGMTGAMKLMQSPDVTPMFEGLGGTPALIFAGLVEVCAAILLLVPRTRVIGAALAAATMLGAIAAHLTVLEDDSMLPVAAILLLVSGFLVFWHRGEAPFVGARFR